ncbi:subtilisin-like serine protease QhpE [Novosphingobium lindaniclasticum]
MTAPDPDRAMPPLFPGRTGRGVRIAVIDSGVHPGHDHIDAARIAPGVAVLADGSLDTGPDAVLDRLGHGTAVTAAILEKAPEAMCLPVRVFREGLKTSAAALVAAIRWSAAQRVDLINLSLGSTNPVHEPVFAAAVAEARAAGASVIAAREAGGVPCLPGMLQGVIGVELDWDCPRARLGLARRGDGPVLLASGYPRAIPGVPHRRNLYGISFAVAQVTGFAALACEEGGAEMLFELTQAT